MVKDKCNKETRSPVKSYQMAMSVSLLFLRSLVIEFISHNASAGNLVIIPHSISWCCSHNICSALKNSEAAKSKAKLSFFIVLMANYLAYSGLLSLSFTFLPLPISSEISNVRQESSVSLAKASMKWKAVRSCSGENTLIKQINT